MLCSTRSGCSKNKGFISGLHRPHADAACPTIHTAIHTLTPLSPEGKPCAQEKVIEVPQVQVVEKIIEAGG